MTFNEEFFIALKWYKKLTGRFLNISSLETIVVIIATLFSQLFLLISSMMPLKVMMLLGSDRIPKFFPISWQSMDRDTLIIYLAIATIFCFVLYLMSEKMIDIFSLKGSVKILENNKKIVLFEKQDIFAKQSYSKLAKSLSDIIFFILSLVGLAFVYPLLSVVIIIFLIIGYFTFYFLYEKGYFSKNTTDRFKRIIDLLKGISFFFIFVFILGSFLADFYPPHLTVVVLSILLIRQMFSKLSGAIKDIVSLYKNRLKINSLFFFKDIKLNVEHDKKDPFWKMFENNVQREWILPLMKDMLDEDIEIIDSQILKINIKNIVFLKININRLKNQKEDTCLLKVFNHNISSQAIHEATFLEDLKGSKESFSLPLLGTTTIEDFHIHLFSFHNIKEVKNYNLENMMVRINMMTIEVSDELINRYRRSHPFLYQRLNSKIFNKLYLVSNEKEKELLKVFEDKFEDILLRIERLPLQIINPLITKFTLLTNDKDNLCLLHYGTWKMEPLGVDFPSAIQHLKVLKENFQCIAEKREELLKIKNEDVALATLMSQFEKFYNGENFTGVFELIPRILECIEHE